MRAPSPNNDGMGSLLYADGTVRFRVWAPNASSINVILDHPKPNTTFALASEPGTGNWSADGIPAPVNTRYQYSIITSPGQDNDTSGPHLRTDARALQVEGADPAKQGYIVDPTLFTTNRVAFTSPDRGDYLIYQLHVGSYTGLHDQVEHTPPTATFVDLASHLDHILNLGFNAIELLPISNFEAGLKTAAGEGYGPSDMFASENLYATSPELAVKELITLIDTAHSKGLAVILDLIFNHASTDDNRYWQYDGNCSGANGIPGGIYFNGGHHTEWGEGFATSQPQIIDFLIDNGRMYLRDYKVDGLRFDAVQAIDPSAVEAIIGQLDSEYPGRYFIAEYNPGDPNTSVAPGTDPFGVLGFSAVWDLGSGSDGYQALDSSAPLSQLYPHIDRFSDPNPWHYVNYLTGSHDQIYGGGTNEGMYFVERLAGREDAVTRAKARLAWALNAALPPTPMMFMGTEGHHDSFWDPVVRSKTATSNAYDHRLDWKKLGDAIGAPMGKMVAAVNGLRWSHPALRSPTGMIVHQDWNNNVLAFKRWNDAGDVLLVVLNAGAGQWANGSYNVSLAGDGGAWREIFSSQASPFGGDKNAVGNTGASLTAAGGYLPISLADWAVHIFQKS